MNNLAGQRCQPCDRGTPPLGAAEAQQYLQQVSGWDMVEGTVLRKHLKMKDFLSVVHLVNKIAEVAEAEDHHPDLHMTGYRHLTIELATHAIGGLSPNDFILAAKLDALLAADEK